MTACEAVKPTVEDVRLVETTAVGAVFEAQINPQNSATSYEFVVVQRMRDPENPLNHAEPASEGLRTAGGPIPAGAGDVAVSGQVTGLEPGYIYWYEVVAANLAGETRSEGDGSFGYFYTGGLSDGEPGVPFKGLPLSRCGLELAEQKAERTAAMVEAERQRYAREREELLAHEDAVRFASEEAALKRREEEEANEAASRVPPCIVPNLVGDTLKDAKRAIGEAHCRLGMIRKPHRHRGVLVVVGQSLHSGVRRADRTVIAVTLGTSRSGHRRLGVRWVLRRQPAPYVVPYVDGDAQDQRVSRRGARGAACEALAPGGSLSG